MLKVGHCNSKMLREKQKKKERTKYFEEKIFLNNSFITNRATISIRSALPLVDKKLHHRTSSKVLRCLKYTVLSCKRKKKFILVKKMLNH